MKVEIKLASEEIVVHTAEELVWEFVDGRVDIYAGEEKIATYRADQVIWVRHAYYRVAL